MAVLFRWIRMLLSIARIRDQLRNAARPSKTKFFSSSSLSCPTKTNKRTYHAF